MSPFNKDKKKTSYGLNIKYSSRYLPKPNLLCKVKTLSDDLLMKNILPTLLIEKSGNSYDGENFFCPSVVFFFNCFLSALSYRVRGTLISQIFQKQKQKKTKFDLCNQIFS